MKYYGILFYTILSVLTLHESAEADRTLRCSGRIVSIGDTKDVVLAKCDEPEKIDIWEEDHNTYVSKIYNYETERYEAPELVKGPIQMERWIYDFGSQRLIRYLLFERGQLIRIDTGGKNGN